MTYGGLLEDEILLAQAQKQRTAGDPHGALRLVGDLIMQSPHRADAHLAAAVLHMDLRRLDLSEQSLRAALELDPDLAAAANFLGLNLIYSDRAAEGMLWLERAAELEPANSTFRRDLGGGQLFIGQISEARENLAMAYELDAGQVDALFAVVRITNMGEQTALTAKLWPWLEAAARRDDAPIAARSNVALALGKALDDAGRYEEAFEALTRGAALGRIHQDYDIDAAERELADVAAIFGPELMKRLAGAGDPTERPVFIVGMPRSGSTLTESIIAAHPAVHAGGELTLLPNMLREARGGDGRGYPYFAAGMTPQDCQLLARTYLDKAPKGPQGARRVTDKQLLNILNVGLIHLMFPKAKVIHVQRDPRDLILSCLTVGFNINRDHGYANDLEHFARYWRAYKTLMAHWRKVLPPGVLLEVAYEDLVRDTETWARRLIAHCGLDWRRECLAFHKRRRLVRTASAAQVREPIYDRAIGRWKPYADKLAPAFSAMGLDPDAPAEGPSAAD